MRNTKKLKSITISEKKYISKGQIKKKTFNLYVQQLISIIEIIIFNLSNYYMSMHKNNHKLYY